jgi:hypothetical protein
MRAHAAQDEDRDGRLVAEYIPLAKVAKYVPQHFWRQFPHWSKQRLVLLGMYLSVGTLVFQRYNQRA